MYGSSPDRLPAHSANAEAIRFASAQPEFESVLIPIDDERGIGRYAASGSDFKLGEPPSSGQSQDDGVQDQSHACPHHRAVDADVLQIAPEEQFQLARRLGSVPPLDSPGDKIGELVVELTGECPGSLLDHTLQAVGEAEV